MYFIGLISGTSMDAIDAAIVDIKSNDIQLLEFHEFPIHAELKSSIREINKQTEISKVMQVDVALGHEFGKAANMIIERSGLSPHDIRAIGSHGQTVLHAAEEEKAYTTQIGDPNIIAVLTGIETVADFRRMDVALGGQGAPLAPLFHDILFADKKPCIVLNVGGIANITVLRDGCDTIGFDSGPANGLMDDWIKLHKNKSFDQDGSWARTGKSDKHLLSAFMDDAYFELPIPKSTGRDYFNLDWVEKIISNSNIHLAAEDIHATLLELTVESISRSVKRYENESKSMIICGGGAKNSYFVEKLQGSLHELDVLTTDDLGFPSAAIEAMCFAWLAHQRIHSKEVNTSSITGARRNSQLGCIYSP